MKGNTNKFFIISVVVFCTLALVLKYDYTNKIALADLNYSNFEKTFNNNNYNDNFKQQLDYYNQTNKNNKPTDTTASQNDEDTKKDALSDLEIPKFENGIDAFMFGEKVIGLASGLHIETSGVVKAPMGINQKVKAVKLKDNNGMVFSESLSHSMFASTGLQTYMTDKQVYYRFASKVSSNLVGTYSDKWEASSQDVFRYDFGVLPDEMNYIVNKNTVEKVENFQHENGMYTFTLVLNPKLSTEKYKKQVKQNSGSSDYPDFKSIQLNVVMNEKGRFVSITTQERYKIKAMGINSEVSATITDTFKVIHGEVSIQKPAGI